MKIIKAYIRPVLLGELYRALRSIGHEGITVFKGEGTGAYSDPDHAHGSLHFPAMHSHVVKVEIVATDAELNAIVEIIQKTASTRSKGDGLILVSPVEKVVRIRDGKTGPDVIN